MDAKITLAFDKAVIEKAKAFAESQNISLSRLTEFLYQKMTSENYAQIEAFPISDWVQSVAEERGEYRKQRSRKDAKSEFFDSKTKK
jgi:hypothetical protein